MLRKTCDELIIAPGSLDATGWLRGAAVAPDLLPLRASVTGIHAAIAASNHGVTTIAWDMPFVPAALLTALQSRLADGTRAVIPIVNGRPEPLCAVYAPGAGPEIAALAAGGTIRVSEILARLTGVVWVDELELRRIGDPDVMFFNVNTPADLDRAQEIAASVD